MFSSQPSRFLVASSRASCSTLCPAAAPSLVPSRRCYHAPPRVKYVEEPQASSSDSPDSTSYGLSGPKKPTPPPKVAPTPQFLKFNFPFSTLTSTDLPLLLQAQTDLHTPETLANLPLEKQREHTAVLTVLRRALNITDESKRSRFLTSAEAGHRLPEAAKSTRLEKAREQVASGKYKEEDAMEMEEWVRMKKEEKREKERRILLEEDVEKVRDKKMASAETAFKRAKTMALARREVIAERKGR